MENEQSSGNENPEKEIQRITKKYSLQSKARETSASTIPVSPEKKRKRSFAVLGLIVVAIIAFLYNNNRAPIIFAGGELNLIANYKERDTIQIEGGLKRVILDAGVISKTRDKKKYEIDRNYALEIKSNDKQIIIHPRKGEWQTPFIGIPADEREAVAPQITAMNGESMKEKGAEFYFADSVKVFGIKTESPNATASMSYMITYKTMPTVIYFGDWGEALAIVKMR